MEDPCKTAYVLEKMDQRYKENIATGSMLCDRFRLGNGRWVRADGQDLLQTEPQPHELCGTRYPIWMKGRSFTKNLYIKIIMINNWKVLQ